MNKRLSQRLFLLAYLLLALQCWSGLSPSPCGAQATFRELNQALLIETKMGNLAAVKTLLAQGADVNARDANGKTALLHALEWHYADLARLLLRHGADVQVRDTASPYFPDATPLHYAVACSLDQKQPVLDVVASLLDKGCDINATDKEGTTPLMVAAGCVYNSRAIPVFFLLLDRGANPHLVSKDGHTALMEASGALYRSAPLEASLVKALLAKKVDVNVKDQSGMSALHRAAEGGRAATARMLLEAGAVVDEQDAEGMTPLLYASYYQRNASIVNLLLKAGANLNVTDKHGNNALAMAVQGGNTAALKVFLHAGANVNQTNLAGETPLMLAATINSLPGVRLLLREGADINRQDAQGFTPLFCAVHRASSAQEIEQAAMGDGVLPPETIYIPMLRFLLDKGAALTLRDKAGRTVLGLAKAEGKPKLAAFLQQAGASE